MFKKIIIYSASTGLQRAFTFLAALALAKSYDMVAVGEYALLLTIAQMLIPILTLNITVAITREAIENQRGAIKLIRTALFANTLIVMVSTLLGLYYNESYWILFGIALGASEAIFACGNSFFLGRERSIHILAVSAAKAVTFIVLICLAMLHLIDIYILAFCLVAHSYVFGLYFVRASIRTELTLKIENFEIVKPRQMLSYSLATLPHTAALWLSVSSDRLILGSILGKEAVAQYIINYTVAQSVMIIISGVVTALPPRIINDPYTWRQHSYVVGFIRKLVMAAIFIIILNLIVVFINRNIFNFIPNLTNQSYLLVGLLSTAFFMSFFYVFFASYLYLNRNTHALKITGFMLAPLNLLVMYACVNIAGQIGASIALIFSYLSFGVAYGIQALKYELFLIKIFKETAVLISLFMVFVVCISGAIGWLDYN
jgi:O-antigen/teichoic acid export membrane protein